MQISTTSLANRSSYTKAPTKANVSQSEISTPTESFSFSSNTEETGFFSTKPTTMGNVKKFAPRFAAFGAAFGGIIGAATGNVGLGLAVGTVYGGAAGLLYGAGRPTN